MPQNRSTGSAVRSGLEAVASGLVVAAQALAWSRMTSPLGGGGSHPDPVVVAAVLAAVAAGAVLAGRLPRRWSRLLPAAPLLGGLVGLGVAPALLALPSFGAGAVLIRGLASLATLAPAGLNCGVLLSRRGARGLPGVWLGAFLGVVLLGWIPELVTPVTALAGLPFLGLLASLWAGRVHGEEQPPSLQPLSARIAAAVGALLLAMTAGAWIRFILLIGGPTGRVRSTVLLVVVAALLLAALAVRFREPRGEARPGLAALALGLAALWAVAAAGMTRPLALLFLGVVGDSGALAPRGAAVLSMAVLLPVTALGALGLHWLGSPGRGAGRSPRDLATVAIAVAAGLAVERTLVPFLGPGRMLIFCAAALPLGLALPVVLGAAGRLRGTWRWGGAAALVLVSLGSLFLPAPRERLLAAGLAWEPATFRFGDRAVLADRMGRRRVMESVASGSGYMARRQISGRAVETTWQGWSLSTDEPVWRGCEAVGAVLPVLLHSAPGRGLVLGVGTAELPGVMKRTAPQMEVDAVPALPGLATLSSPSESALAISWSTAPASAWVTGRGYDVILLRPLAPQISASGLAWSVEGFAQARQALKEGGLLALSLDPAAFSTTAFRRALATFLHVFPHASLWFDGQALVLIGATGPLRLSLPDVERRFRQADPAIRDAGLQRPQDLLARFVMPAAGLAALSEGVAPERVRHPRMGDDAFHDGPDDAGGGDALLARLAVLPADVLTFFPDLDDEQRDSVRSEIAPAAETMSHLLALRGLARTDLQTAVEHGQAALALRPEDRLVRAWLANLSYRAARSRVESGYLEESLGWAERAVELDPTRVDHHLALYDLVQQVGRESAAQRRLNEMAIRFPGSYPVHLIQARRRLEQGDVNAGEALLRRAAETGYETADLALGFAQVAFARGQMGRGREMLSRALGLGMDPALVLGDMGGRLQDTHPELAVEFLRRALDLGNDGPQVTGPLGQQALRDGDYQRAISLLEAAVSRQPTNARLRLDLGASLLLAGRSTEAVSHLQEAVRLAPGDPLVRLNLAVALAREDRREEARDQVEKIGDRLPDNPVLLRLRRDLRMEEPAEARPGS